MSETVPKKWGKELQVVLAELTRLEREAAQFLTTWGRALGHLRARVQVLAGEAGGGDSVAPAPTGVPVPASAPLSAAPPPPRPPASPASPEDGGVAPAPTGGEPRGRVLIIDDEAFIVTVVRDRLQASGFEVFTAKNGTEGIEQARRHQPDVIVLDVMMSGIDGYETCRRLKRDEATREIGVIMLTALDKERLQTKALQAGAEWTVPKTLDPAKLIGTIGLALQSRHRKAQ